MKVRVARFYDCAGRLRQGVSAEQAQAELRAVQQQLGAQYPKTDSGWSVAVETLKDRLTGNVRVALWLLFGSVAVLLLIACTNVACLLLAQCNRRMEEVTTRFALGASRSAIARQMLAEGLMYALAGGVAGVAIALAAIKVVQQGLTELPRIEELAVDVRVLVFVACISMAAAILFSLAPIARSFQLSPGERVIRVGRGATAHGQRLPRILVGAQLALATVLVVSAGLFLKSLVRLQETPLGFRTDNVLTFRVSASFSEDADAVVQRHRRTLEALSLLEGTVNAAMSSGLPGTIAGTPLEFRIAGEAHDAHGQFAIARSVTAGYFQSLSIPILRGEACRMNPDPQRAFEALVNRTFVNRFLQGREAVGRTISHGPQGNARTMQITGVVEDTREAGYSHAVEPVVYACGFLRFWPDSDFLIRIRGAPDTMAHAIRDAVRAIEPARAVYAVRPLSDVLYGTLSLNRFRTLLVGVFSGISVVLAAIGLYGVTAYMVAQRTREFGIRMALGASSAEIWAEILRSGGQIAGAGAAIGIALALVTSKLIATLLYGVEVFDLSTYLYTMAVLFAAAALACVIPGRRATSIDPSRALREQ